MEILFVFILGLFFGSFYNVVAMRTLKGESIVISRSHCTSCNHDLWVLDLVPVFSYLFLRGKCRYCGVKISPLYCFGELITGITFAFLYSIFGPTLDFVIHLVMGSVLTILVISDLIDKTIPNKIVFWGFVMVLILRLIKGEDVFFYILSSLGVFLLLFLFMVGSGNKLGGGDVKLYSVIGLTIGAWKALASIFFASTVALIVAVPLLITKKIDRKFQIPFVPFIWVGVLLSYFIEFNLF